MQDVKLPEQQKPIKKIKIEAKATDLSVKINHLEIETEDNEVKEQHVPENPGRCLFTVTMIKKLTKKRHVFSFSR